MFVVNQIHKQYFKMNEKMSGGAENVINHANEGLPEGITTVCDIPYIPDGRRVHTLDVCCPEGTDKPLPTIIFLHGGGWMYGLKELNRFYCSVLAGFGFSVVVPNFPYAPGTKVAAQLQDLFAVYHWLDKHGKEYCCDTDNVFITGESAGGHLAMTSCIIMGKPGLPEEFGLRLPEFRFKGAGLSCAALDLSYFQTFGYSFFKDFGRLLFGWDYKKSPLFPYLDPMSQVEGSDIPPVYLLSSREDVIGFMSLAFAKRLEELGKPYQARHWDKVPGKKLIHVFNLFYPLWEESMISHTEMTDYFKKYMDIRQAVDL